MRNGRDGRREREIPERADAVTSLPLLADLCPHEYQRMVDRLVVAPVVHDGVEVCVRPVPHDQCGEFIHAPRLAVMDVPADPVADVCYELLEVGRHAITV